MWDADDLELYFRNEEALVHGGQHRSILRNLAQKWQKGTFDESKAAVLYGYLADEVAKRAAGSLRGVPKAERTKLARSLARQFAQAARSGTFDTAKWAKTKDLREEVLYYGNPSRRRSVRR